MFHGLQGFAHGLLDQRSLYDSHHLRADVFERRRVDVDAVQFTGSLRQTHILVQPLRKVIGHQFESQPGFNEVVVDGVYADLPQSLGKTLHGRSYKAGWHHGNVGRAEVKSVLCWALAGGRVVLQKFDYDLNESLPQSRHRSEFSDIDAGQSFRQTGFIASGKRPVRKVVGKTLANKVMLLPSAESVLENGIFRTIAQSLEEFRERIRPVRRDAQQMGRSVEIKRLRRRAMDSEYGGWAGHPFTAIAPWLSRVPIC